jgi:hypothetical protein
VLCCAVLYLRNLIGVEVKQQFFLVVAAKKDNLFGGARGQHALDGGPQEFENAWRVQEEATAKALRVEVLQAASM